MLSLPPTSLKSYSFSDTLFLFPFFQRDIWRRGGLDSISEDEEEEDEEIETNALDGVLNHVNHANQSNHIYGNSTQFNRRPGHKLNLFRRPNHFKPTESWSGLKKNNASEWRNRTNDIEKQPLCVLPSERDSSTPQTTRSLIRQLSVDVNTGSKNNALVSSREEISSQSEPFSDPSMEWDQENFTFKNDANSLHDENDGESFEMKNMNSGISVSVMEEIEEEEHDERDKLLTQHLSSEDESTDENSQASDSIALTKKCSRDFSKHLYLGCEENDIDRPDPYLNGSLGAIPETDDTGFSTAKKETEDTPRGLYNNVGDTSRGLYDDVDDAPRSLHNGDTLRGLYDEDIEDTLRGQYDDVESIGYTDFGTMVNGTRSPRFLSSPPPEGSIPTSPIDSSHGSCRSGFSELPFRGSFTDSLKLSAPSTPYGSPKGIKPTSNSGNPRDFRENSAGSSKNSGCWFGLEKPDSPRNKFGSIFSEFRAPSPSAGSLKDGLFRERTPRKRALRRTLTEFHSPTSSCNSLNEKPAASPRRRKVSGAIPPPMIFAPLVTNVNNPYKDFVPPVRESPITCDCEPDDEVSCEGLGLISKEGKECDFCYERKRDSFGTGNYSEDKREDFFGNAGDFITDKQLRGLSGTESEHHLSQNDQFPSQSTLTSETSFDRGELQSDPSQKIDGSCNSVRELSENFERQFPSYSNIHRKPSLSGAYSTQCIEKEEIPESDELPFRPMRSSFSEPHLSLRIPVINEIAEQRFSEKEENVESTSIISQDTATQNLEDIFRDVSSTKEAIEKLGLILSSPEPDIYTDLADTKQTVQKLDQQVLNLNKEVASLSSDVKTVLELLKSLKNGQVVV